MPLSASAEKKSQEKPTWSDEEHEHPGLWSDDKYKHRDLSNGDFNDLGGPGRVVLLDTEPGWRQLGENQAAFLDLPFATFKKQCDEPNGLSRVCSSLLALPPTPAALGDSGAFSIATKDMIEFIKGNGKKLSTVNDDIKVTQIMYSELKIKTKQWWKSSSKKHPTLSGENQIVSFFTALGAALHIKVSQETGISNQIQFLLIIAAKNVLLELGVNTSNIVGGQFTCAVRNSQKEEKVESPFSFGKCNAKLCEFVECYYKGTPVVRPGIAPPTNPWRKRSESDGGACMSGGEKQASVANPAKQLAEKEKSLSEEEVAKLDSIPQDSKVVLTTTVKAQLNTFDSGYLTTTLSESFDQLGMLGALTFPDGCISVYDKLSKDDEWIKALSLPKFLNLCGLICKSILLQRRAQVKTRDEKVKKSPEYVQAIADMEAELALLKEEQLANQEALVAAEQALASGF